MNELVVFVAHNTLVATVLSLFVYGLSRVWRNPPLAHVLWLLVLVKLVAPPLIYVNGPAIPQLDSWLASGKSLIGELLKNDQPVNRELSSSSPRTQFDPQRVDLQDQPATSVPTRETNPGSMFNANPHHAAPTALEHIVHQVAFVLLGIWLGVAVIYAMLLATRIVRFERLLGDTLPVPERLQRMAAEVGDKLGITKLPKMCYVESIDVPLLWCVGRGATIALPIQLFRKLDDQDAALILAHELAHFRRRDHWVRAFELVVATLYWWNPLVWIVRRQIHQAEELCCDAWVRWFFPHQSKRYADLMLTTAESLNASTFGSQLLPASPILRSYPLKARIEMILHGKFAPFVSRKSVAVVGILGVLILPTFVDVATPHVNMAEADDAARIPISNATSEFPFVVNFEQGASNFAKGDGITIREVRGTAATFIPGHIYCIKGSYVLASHDRAHLSAYVTAMDAANGRSGSYRPQSMLVDKGEGMFTLFLPMGYVGWPHVSYYPAKGGEGFGGTYFGTGENSVLRHWWTSQGNSTKQNDENTVEQPKFGHVPQRPITYAVHANDIQYLGSVPEVQSLDVVDAKSLTDEQFRQLLSKPNLVSLKVRQGHLLTNDCLTNIGNLRLRSLMLDTMKIDDRSVVHLKKFNQLEHLVIRQTLITQKGIDELASALPDTKITYQPLVKSPSLFPFDYP